MRLQEAMPVSNLAEPKRHLLVVHPDIAPAAARGWRRARQAVRWLATATLIGGLIVSTDWSAVGPAFAKASLPWFVLAAAFYLSSQIGGGLRWEILVRAAGFVQSRRRLFAAYFEGMFVNVCLPTTMGGDVLKVLRVGGAQHKRVATSTVIADRASGFAALLLLLAAGLLMKFGPDGYLTAPLLAAAIVLLIIIFLFVRHAANSIGSVDHGRDSKLRRQFTRFVPLGVRQLVLHTPWPRVIFWAFLVQGLNVAA